MNYTITTTPNIIGDEVEIKAYGITYTNIGNYSSLECDNLDNNREIRLRLNKIANLIKEIEELNK